MKRHKQTEEEIISAIGEVRVDWRDDHFDAVQYVFTLVPTRGKYSLKHIASILDSDFEAARTGIRLILDLSKDAFDIVMKEKMGPGLGGKTGYSSSRGKYLNAIESLGALGKLSALAAKNYTWRDILSERLKSGRGSAIKGQRRGKALEDFAEALIKNVFHSTYETRCSFLGADGVTAAKCDFAIPSASDPRIVLESKAYGATGSKQSDVLGDAEMIIRAKRHDTHFLLLTDGVTWKERRSDLRKLIQLQNEGKIARIYTQAMKNDLLRDLKTLRKEHSL